MAPAQYGAHDGIPNRFGAVSCQSLSILDSQPCAVTLHPRQVQKHREARRTLGQRTDRRAARPWNEDVFRDLVRPGHWLLRDVANYDFRRHETFTALIDTRPRHQQRPSAGEAGAVADLMPSQSLVPSNATLVLRSVVTSPPAASSGAGRSAIASSVEESRYLL